jgi:hypothetical protein
VTKSAKIGAAAYAEAGDFASAIARQNQAIQLARGSSKENDDMKQRLRLYQQQKPYRNAK